MDDSPWWPRAFLYPDRWLYALNNYYDKLYPVPPTMIKLHGELDRVRLTVGCGFCLFVSVSMIGLLPIAYQWHRADQMKKPGFPISTTGRRVEPLDDVHDNE